MKQWGNLAGTVFAVLAMAAVLYLYGGELKSVDLGDESLLQGMTAAVALYVTVVLMGSVAWKYVLKAFGARPSPWSAERQLLLSQIGKYIPGNVAQYVGRAAMAVSSGLPGGTVTIALAAEAATTVVAGILVVATLIALSPYQLVPIQGHLPSIPMAGWITLVVAALLVVAAGAKVVSSFPAHFAGLKLRAGQLLVAFLLYVTSFVLLGMSLEQIVKALSPTPVPFFISIAVFAAAWIVGLVTPGAPGGLGVRETVLTLGLAPYAGGTAALTAALLYRGVSVIGDVISFGLGFLLPKDPPDYRG